MRIQRSFSATYVASVNRKDSSSKHKEELKHVGHESLRAFDELCESLTKGIGTSNTSGIGHNNLELCAPCFYQDTRYRFHNVLIKGFGAYKPTRNYMCEAGRSRSKWSLKTFKGADPGWEPETYSTPFFSDHVVNADVLWTLKRKTSSIRESQKPLGICQDRPLVDSILLGELGWPPDVSGSSDPRMITFWLVGISIFLNEGWPVSFWTKDDQYFFQLFCYLSRSSVKDGHHWHYGGGNNPECELILSRTKSMSESWRYFSRISSKSVCYRRKQAQTEQAMKTEDPLSWSSMGVDSHKHNVGPSRHMHCVYSFLVVQRIEPNRMCSSYLEPRRPAA